MKSCYTIFVLLLVVGFVLTSSAGSERDSRHVRTTTPTSEVILQPVYPVSINATILYVDSLNGANDTTALKARGYKPYYRGTGPQGLTATWYQGRSGVFPAYNGPDTGYVAANYNVVTGANNIDSWLVLPRLNLLASDSLKFFEKSDTNSSYPDSVRVMYSAAGDSIPEAGTWVELGRFKTTTNGTWRQRQFAAPAAGATARFAIRYAVVNGGPSGVNSDYMGIDMITIERTVVSGTPQHYNYNTTGSTNSFPFNISLGKQIQLLFLPGDFAQPTPAPAGNITTVFFRLAANLGPYTYSQFVIKMGQTDITTFATGAWYSGQLDTVYSRSSVTLGGLANEWMSVTLDRPFLYNPARSLVIDVQQCGASGATGFSSGTTTLTGFRRNTSLVGSSCPFPWGQQSSSMHHIGVNIAPAATNRALLLPTPGVNTNYVQIPFQASMVGFGNNITIEAWVRTGGSTTANTILNKGAASFDYQLGINTTTANPFFRAGATIVIASTVTITPAVWTHLAATYDGTTVKFYKDGVMAFSQASALTLGSSTNEMRIGRGNADPGSGNIEEVRLWSVARTQGQIDSTKCKKYPGEFASTVGLKALWHFDSTYVDSVSGYNGTPLGTVGFEAVTLPCGPVGVTENDADIPAEYQLAQNYPNPFNPTTTIQYGLPSAANVVLKIYNTLGQEVAMLVNDQKTPGTFQVVWDGRNDRGQQVSTGVYFYSLVAQSTDGKGSFTNIKKMLLLK